jgi:hypothetical protein
VKAKLRLLLLAGVDADQEKSMLQFKSWKI